MKLGIFTDPHYSSAKVTCSNRYNSKSLDKITSGLIYFKKQNCNLIICLGDLIDKENNHEKEIENLQAVSNVFALCDIPIFVVMGNHDAFTFNKEEFYNILGTQYHPQNITIDNNNLIFLDTCYFKNGKHYTPGDSDWTDTFLPNAQSLKNQLESLYGNTYIFMHQNIDPAIHESHRLSNDITVRAILEKSGKVKSVFQGHFHQGGSNEIGGIKYITYPAVCSYDNAFYIIEI